MSLFKSLAFKYAIIYLVIFLTGLAMLGYLLLDSSSNRIIVTAENELKHNGDLVEIQLRDYINGLVSDMYNLSNSPILDMYLANKSETNYKLLAHSYLTLIQSYEDFSQIRLLNAKDGAEVVRVDQRNGNTSIAPKDQLQNKSDRQYIQEAIKLTEGDIYFSEINLNRDFGKISKPLTPTLRVARPIYLDGKINSVIVINTDLTKLFARLNEAVGDNFNMRMINDQGYYIMHENVDSTFIFEFGNASPQIYNPKDKSPINHNRDQLVSTHRFSYEYMQYDIIYQVIASRSILLGPYYMWRNQSIFLILLTGLLFTIIAFTILNRQSKSLREVTDNMKLFPNRKVAGDLPLHREDEIGELARGFSEMTDIINNQINSIEAEKLKAEKAEKEKSEFIENISHEIRNPLQSIIGLSNILEQNKPNANQIDILKSIKLNTSNLHGLVNNILDYQNVLKGATIINQDWCNINDLIQEISTGNQYAAEQKSILIKSDKDASLDNMILKIDRLRVSQVLNNLIANALTHTLSGGQILIKSKLVKNNTDRACVLLSVIDDGIGMSQEYLSKITDRYFTQNSETNNKNFGLGLTIVNEILGQLNSKLNVTSKENVGSTFSFELTSPFKEERKDQNIEYTNLEHLNILVVDDDEQILELYKHMLRSCTVKYSMDFSEIDRGDKYDIIIADNNLAQSQLSDHIDTIKEITTDDFCLIVVSGANNHIDILKEEFPNLQIALKPVSHDDLLSIIESGLVLSKYNSPQIQEIKKDYDYDSVKYTAAIRLLISEWKKYENRIISSIDNNDVSEMEDTIHKFNTTLRRLKLAKLELKLVSIKDEMIDGTINRIEVKNEINKIMRIMLDKIKSNLD